MNQYNNMFNMNQNNMFPNMNQFNMNQNNNFPYQMMNMPNMNNLMFQQFQMMMMNNIMNNNMNNNMFQQNNNMNNNMFQQNNNNMNNNVFQQNNNNMNNNTFTQNNDNKGQAPKEQIPRGDKTINLTNEFPNVKKDQLTNVNLFASSGLKVVMKVPYYISFKQLFRLYSKKVGFSETLLGKAIIFLLNAQTLDVNSESQISTKIKSKDFTTITVIDQNNVIGAIKIDLNN